MLLCIDHFIAVCFAVRVVLEITHRDHAGVRNAVAKTARATTTVEFIEDLSREHARFEDLWSVLVHDLFEVFVNFLAVGLESASKIEKLQALGLLDVGVFIQLPYKFFKIRKQIKIRPPKTLRPFLVFPEHE